MHKNMYVISMVGLLTCVNVSLYAAHEGRVALAKQQGNYKIQRRWSEADMSKATGRNKNWKVNLNLRENSPERAAQMPNLVAMQFQIDQLSHNHNSVNEWITYLEGQRRGMLERINALEQKSQYQPPRTHYPLGDGRTLIFPD